MSIAALQKDFERLAKKQRTARCSRNEKLDSLLQELERAKEEIEAQDEIMDEDGTKGDAQDGAAGSVQAVVEQLESSVKAANIGETLAAENKELCYLITKFGKAVDRQMPPDLERAIKPVPIDSKLLNQVIVEHFLRSGRIDLAKHLATEAEVDLPEEKVAPYAALVSILDAIKSRELGQAREWAAQYAGPLAHRNSPLPFRLARMHFLQLVEGGKVEEAIAFARASFPKFAAQHLLEVQKLMGTLVYAKRLPGSPYETLFEPEAWESVGRLFRRESCEVLGLAHDLPLAVSVHAGVRALPSLLKFATVMHAKMGDWHAAGREHEPSGGGGAGAGVPLPLRLRVPCVARAGVQGKPAHDDAVRARAV
eukprot:CAMPEP_0181296268 /NCGR_PEP_ID=MMETSP1101-20121128/4609_1 /TAXON_ID=46948 /ORGANISM="Rhodomonas abbreviata, Strain Caron Lab Isolate" /LENGTH=366 /DNA_ID=CAMNT_0023401113 /DNA_START=241 /DNA_END=1340 /DNA_ORIENTATION=-